MDNIVITNSLDAPGAAIYAPSIIVDDSFRLAANQQAAALEFGAAHAASLPAAQLVANSLVVPGSSGIEIGGRSLMEYASDADLLAAVDAQGAPDRADRVAADQLLCGQIVGNCAVPASGHVRCLSARAARAFQFALALSEAAWQGGLSPAPLMYTAELDTSDPRTIRFADGSEPKGAAECAPVGAPGASVAMAPSGELVALNDPGIGHRVYRVSGLDAGAPLLAEIMFSAESAEAVEWTDDSLHLFGFDAAGDMAFVTDIGAARCRLLP